MFNLLIALCYNEECERTVKNSSQKSSCYNKCSDVYSSIQRRPEFIKRSNMFISFRSKFMSKVKRCDDNELGQWIRARAVVLN